MFTSLKKDREFSERRNERNTGSYYSPCII